MSLAIIVHGGAKEIPPEDQEPSRRGCAAAAQVGWNILKEGGSALDAVEAAIRALEDDPTFNAGYGSDLNSEGEVQMDSGLMEGAELQAGAVGAIQGVRHPVSVARLLVDRKEILLVGPDARQFAAQKGAELCDPADLITEKQRRAWEEKQRENGPADNDTVGAVAIDCNGNLACGTSTGGTGTNPPGRVGDSPLVGCGFYADNQAGACALTGDGEQIMRVALGYSVVALLRDGCEPDEAARKALARLEERVEGEAGIILIDREGRIGWDHNATHMAVAYRTEAMSTPAAYVKKEEEGTRHAKAA